MTADPFVDAVRTTVDRHRLVGRGERVLVALSGGPDSVALLHVLAALRGALGHELHALTVDHGLRDASAEHDLCAAQAAGLGVPWELCPVTVERVDGSLMQGAREARLAALEAAAARLGARRIATGHTASDQAETVLLRLLRGAGTRGLAGILPARGPWIRPLLAVTRVDVFAYLAAVGAQWAEDPTNDSPAFLRNRVRHEVLPLLRALAPSVDAHLCAAADHAREDRLAIESLAEDVLRGATVESGPGVLALDLDALGRAHRSLLPHVLRRAVERVRRREGDLWRAHIEALVQLARGRAGTASLDLPGARATRVYAVLRFEARRVADDTASAPLLLDGKEIPGPGCYRVGPHLVTVDRLPPGAVIERGPDAVTFDAAGLEFPLLVRPWQPGDRIVPFGSTHRRKVSDVLVDAKIPAVERPGVLVLEGPQGIVWVVGVRRGAACPVEGGARDVLRVRIHRYGHERR